MSGHSKWHSIRRSKGILDNKRGALFTKLAREISIACREGGGGDMDTNFRLRVAVQKARADNMPADNIKRAIEKGLGISGDGPVNYEEITYEGYGPGGVAILVKAVTDNRNRTSSEVRNAFTKGGGNPGEIGSVGWMFEHLGLIRIEPKGDTDELMLTAIDAGASDVQELVEDGQLTELEVYTSFEDMRKVQESLEKGGVKVISSEDVMISKNLMDLDDAKSLQVLRLMEKLEDLDDVQNVYSNLNIRDEVAAM
jgi:YebC/PmpR family DNA-binding regulatory protein